MIVNLAFHATELCDILAKIASDEFLTACRVRKARMGQFLAVRTEDVLFGAEESVNAFGFSFDFTLFRVNGGLFGPYASALGLVENKASSAGKLVRFSIDTVIEPKYLKL